MPCIADNGSRKGWIPDDNPIIEEFCQEYASAVIPLLDPKEFIYAQKKFLSKWRGHSQTTLKLLCAYPTQSCADMAYQDIADPTHKCMNILIEKLGTRVQLNNIFMMDRSCVRQDITTRIGQGSLDLFSPPAMTQLNDAVVDFMQPIGRK